MSKAAAPAQNASQAARGFELLDHTGDIKLRVHGASLAQLFVNAARGMMACLFGEEAAAGQPQHQPEPPPRPAHELARIEITARDREALLVDWLSELLYRALSEHRAYLDFHIEEIEDRRLVATAGVAAAEAIDDIKAVTHHELSIRPHQGGWEATVVLDI
jgi:SHS2 domain-containing protein